MKRDIGVVKFTWTVVCKNVILCIFSWAELQEFWGFFKLFFSSESLMFLIFDLKHAKLCFYCWLKQLPSKSCGQLNWHFLMPFIWNHNINTLCWCCCLFFSHWSAPLVIESRLLEVTASASLMTQNSNLPHMTVRHFLYQSYLLRPFKLRWRFSAVNMAPPQHICITSFLMGDFIPFLLQTHSLKYTYVVHRQGCVDNA